MCLLTFRENISSKLRGLGLCVYWRFGRTYQTEIAGMSWYVFTDVSGEHISPKLRGMGWYVFTGFSGEHISPKLRGLSWYVFTDVSGEHVSPKLRGLSWYVFTDVSGEHISPKLRGLSWYVFTDVSGEHICPKCKCEAVKDKQLCLRWLYSVCPVVELLGNTSKLFGSIYCGLHVRGISALGVGSYSKENTIILVRCLEQILFIPSSMQACDHEVWST